MSTLLALLHEPRLRPRWRALFIVLVAVTAWFAFMPVPPKQLETGLDKLDHLLAFGALASVLALSLPPGRRPALAAAVGLLGYGVFIEAVQSLLPLRSAEWGDIAADALGLVGGLMLIALLRRWRPLSIG